MPSPQAQDNTAETKPLGVAKFISWIMLVLVLISSGVLSVVISNSARTALLAKQQDFSLLLAENLNNQIYRRFTLPTLIGFKRIALRNPQQYARLDQVVNDTILGLRIESLRIYDQAHTVAYSSKSTELGNTTFAGLAVRKALVDRTVSFDIESSISPLAAMFHVAMKPGTFIMRTTYPLIIKENLGKAVLDEKNLPIMGALEITQDITADVSDVVRFQWLIVSVSLISSFLLFGVLVLIIRRAENALNERLIEKQRLERELHQNEKLAGMGRVVASIAHEIRNPLGIISSSAELLLGRPNADTLTKKILGAIHDEAKRLSKTVHDFLDYARPKQPNFDTVDAALVIDQALGFLENELTQQQVAVVREYTQGLNLPGDHDLLYRAFYNIVSNGVQALEGAGTIRIHGENDGGAIVLSFIDSGAGFDLSNIDKLLDPFFTTKDDGTGLGLAIVNSIVTSHKGTMALTNAENGGAVVTMRFPAA